MTGADTPAWMAGCGLPQAWRAGRSLRILDTALGGGERLLDIWQAWAGNAAAPPMLHLVVICTAAPELQAMRAGLMLRPALSAHADELARQWFGLLPGFHRLQLHDARLQLTLCIGPMASMLRELQFQADLILLGHQGSTGALDGQHSDSGWDHHRIKAVTRLCQRNTCVAVWPGCPVETAALAQAGLVAAASQSASADLPAERDPHATAIWHFQPRWQITNGRSQWRRAPSTPGECVVVGAGLAGAALAHALATRGWKVTVLDRAPQPAAGASGLPVGLLVPQTSRDDNPRSRLSRAGIRMALDLASRLLRQGQDWDWGGVLELLDASEPALPRHWPAEGADWSRVGLPQATPAHPGVGLLGAGHARWHAGAGWIKPARLVQAMLDHPGIRFIGGSPVQGIARHAGAWRVLDGHGQALAEAPQLVLACAGESVRLLNHAACAGAAPARLLPLTAVHGQVSWAAHGPADTGLFPPFAVNGAGSAIAHVPQADGASAWFVGASYEAQAAPLDPDVAHTRNQGRLARLLPEAERVLAPAFAAGKVHAWRGTRWTAPDRLPLAGAAPMPGQDGLYVSTAMGSRGLTHAVLCANCIAASIGAEPAPLEASLMRLLDPGRRAMSGKLSDHL